jgi:O-antigen/teichoic acid export membrane protein
MSSTDNPELTAGTGSGVDRARPVIARMLLSASSSTILQGGSLVLGFATGVLLARLLGSEGYGRYVFCFTWASLLTIPAILGLDRFLVRGIAVYEVQQNWALMRGLLRRSYQAVLITSISVMVVGLSLALFWLPSSLRWPFCVAMLLIPFTALTFVRQGAMQAVGRVVTGQFPEYVIRPVLLLGCIGALHVIQALTATTALAANVAGVAVACAIGAVMLRRALPVTLRSVQPAYKTRDWMRSSLPMMLISGVWMANNYLTTLVIGTLDSAKAVGVYSAAQKGAELIVIVLLAANMPLAPAIARMYARGDRRGLEHTTERIAKATFIVSAPVAAFFVIFPELYLSLFGASFRAGATALVVLAVGQLVNAASGPAGNILIMTGHERAAVRGMGAGMLANIVLSVVLVPRLGVTGGGIAFASSLLLWNTILVVLARRRVGVNVTAFRSLSMVTRSP